MSKLELKSAFIVGIDSTRLMKNFLKKEMKIEIIQDRPCAGRYIIDVPKDDYERVLMEGQKYVSNQNLSSVSWINSYNVAVECGYIQLAYAILKRRRKGNPMWCLDKYLPEDILEYLTKMREALGVNVGHSYNIADRALCFAPQSLDYQKQLELMKEFIIKEGTGPFSRIIPTTYTGELQKEESFCFIKVKK